MWLVLQERNGQLLADKTALLESTMQVEREGGWVEEREEGRG